MVGGLITGRDVVVEVSVVDATSTSEVTGKGGEVVAVDKERVSGALQSEGRTDVTTTAAEKRA